MSCAAPTFFLLLEDGGYLLLEDAGHIELELASVTGAFVCGEYLPPRTQLFPPTAVTASPPPNKACAQPADLPALALTGCVANSGALPIDSTVSGACAVALPIDPA